MNIERALVDEKKKRQEEDLPVYKLSKIIKELRRRQSVIKMLVGKVHATELKMKTFGTQNKFKERIEDLLDSQRSGSAYKVEVKKILEKYYAELEITEENFNA